MLFSNPCPHCLCDLGAEWCIGWEGKEDGSCCNKLKNSAKRLGFALLFMGFFGFLNAIFILDTKKMSSYQERMWELTVQRNLHELSKTPQLLQNQEQTVKNGHGNLQQMNNFHYL